MSASGCPRPATLPQSLIYLTQPFAFNLPNTDLAALAPVFSAAAKPGGPRLAMRFLVKNNTHLLPQALLIDGQPYRPHGNRQMK